MKLYDVPRNSRIKVIGDIKIPVGSLPITEGQELNFESVDGIYSYCTDDYGNIFHLAAWAEVKVINK